MNKGKTTLLLRRRYRSNLIKPNFTMYYVVLVSQCGNTVLTQPYDFILIYWQSISLFLVTDNFQHLET